jgi:hypothetical protein
VAAKQGLALPAVVDTRGAGAHAAPALLRQLSLNNRRVGAVREPHPLALGGDNRQVGLVPGEAVHAVGDEGAEAALADVGEVAGERGAAEQLGPGEDLLGGAGDRVAEPLGVRGAEDLLGLKRDARGAGPSRGCEKRNDLSRGRILHLAGIKCPEKVLGRFSGISRGGLMTTKAGHVPGGKSFIVRRTRTPAILLSSAVRARR